MPLEYSVTLALRYGILRFFFLFFLCFCIFYYSINIIVVFVSFFLFSLQYKILFLCFCVDNACLCSVMDLGEEGGRCSLFKSLMYVK